MKNKGAKPRLVLIHVVHATGLREPLWWDGHGWVPSEKCAAPIDRGMAESLLKKMATDKFLVPTNGTWKFPTIVEGDHE